MARQYTKRERWEMHIRQSDLCSKRTYALKHEPTESEIKAECEKIQRSWSPQERYSRLVGDDCEPYGLPHWMQCTACQKPSEYADPDGPPVRCRECLRLEEAINAGRYSKMGYNYCNDEPTIHDLAYHGAGTYGIWDNEVWWSGL